MTNLTTTQPAAFDAFVALVTAAGSTQTPTVPVWDSAVMYEQASYVVFEAIEQHEFDIAALGSFAFEETYDICGSTTYYQGDLIPATPQAVRDQTFALHQAVVQQTVVANSGIVSQGAGPPLGSEALRGAGLLWIVPSFARYSGGPGDIDGKPAGWQGIIEWRFTLKARITV